MAGFEQLPLSKGYVLLLEEIELLLVVKRMLPLALLAEELLPLLVIRFLFEWIELEYGLHRRVIHGGGLVIFLATERRVRLVPHGLVLL